ncbi:MAG TPA: hypothetical protein DHW63_08665 [Hyphomonadaceae bacterium]|nr:hypothetical protein [Hyphomonadaceae bacterium]
MEGRGTFWTAMLALIISLMSGTLTFFEAMQGPQVKALPVEDVFIFAYPEDGQLAAVARPEIANSAASYSDILLSQAIVILAGEEERACLSARGQALFHSQPGQVAGQPPLRLEVANAAEATTLKDMALEIRDVSSRATLKAGELFSIRQLFDQRANRSGIDPCRRFHTGTVEAPYTAAGFVQAFRGQSVLMRYEARFENDPGYLVDCSFELTDRRADLILTRGHINVPCAGAPPRQMPSERGLWQRLGAAFDRLF